MDYAPIGNTCPTIDRLIDKLESALIQCKYYVDNPINDDLTYDMGTAVSYIEEVIEGFEDIRSDNSELREWGNNLYNQLEVLEERVSDLENELSNCE